jgi:hypothetical protein
VFFNKYESKRFYSFVALYQVRTINKPKNCNVMRKYFQASHLFLGFFTMAVLISSCRKEEHASSSTIQSNVNLDDASVAIDWYNLQLRLLLERNSTMNGVMFGYLGIGLYESIQPGIKNAKSLSAVLYQMPQMPQKENNQGYDWKISANAAMAALLKSYNTGLTPANLVTIDSLENAYNQKLMPGNGTKFERSRTFGKNIAAAVHAWSLTDNFNPANAGYVYPEFDGGWVPTPPAFVNPPVLPFLSTARPLLASSVNNIGDPPPFAYSEDPSSDFYKMIKEVYDVSVTLTQEQKDIAMFWVDQGNGVGYTPPGHDFSVILQAIVNTGADLATAAEALAKAGIAERDATIVCFVTKYEYNRIRPVSFIREFIDNTWSSFIPTPPHPEYPAAHAFITGAAMKAAEKVIGITSITDHTYDFRGWNPRTYNSLFDAAREAGISRLYGGIHYRKSIEIGLVLGDELGSEAGDLDLKD